jgi:hypothetical protein
VGVSLSDKVYRPLSVFEDFSIHCFAFAPSSAEDDAPIETPESSWLNVRLLFPNSDGMLALA